MRLNAILPFLFVLAILAACGGVTSTPTIQDGVNALAGARCAKMAACDPLEVQLDYGDVGTCTGVLAAQQQLSADLPGSGATPASLEACAQAITSLSCTAMTGSVPAACQFAGTVQSGGACSNGAQCVASDTCWIPQGQTCGTCTVLAGLGQSCASTGCVSGTICVTSPSDSRCVALVTVGAPCDDTTHICASSLNCTSGTCAAPLGLGAACDPAYDLCDDGSELYCGADHTCIHFGVAKVGEACGVADGVQTRCSGLGVWCKSLPSSPSGGTCEPPIEDGQSCAPPQFPVCKPPARCIGGVCSQPTAPTCP